MAESYIGIPDQQILRPDDHGMHIIGLAVDQSGNAFCKVKNSWGVTGRYDGSSWRKQIPNLLPKFFPSPNASLF